MPAPGARTIAFCALLAAALLAAYLPARNAPYYLDDVENIRDNPSVRFRGGDIGGKVRSILFEGRIRTRPLAYLSFGIGDLVSGDSPSGHRWPNVAVHILSALLLAAVVARILRHAPGARLEGPEIAAVSAAAAVLWGAHPAMAPSVVYVVQRMNGWMAFFFLLAFYFFLRSWESPAGKRRTAARALCAISFAAALGFKEVAVTFPFVAFAAWLLLKRGGEPVGRVLEERGPRIAALGLGAAGAAGLLAAAWLAYPTFAATRDFTLWERLLTEPRVLARYLSIWLVPGPGAVLLEYDVAVSRSPFDPPSTALAIALALALAALVPLLAWKDKVLAFALFWFLFNLVPESTVLNLELMFAHRLYLPSAGLALFVAYGGFRLAKSLSPGAWTAKYAAACVLFSVLLLSATAAFNRSWADPRDFYARNIAASPGKERLYTGLTYFDLERGDFGRVLDRGNEALRRFPGRRSEDLAKIRNNMAIANVRMGRIDDGIAIWESLLAEYGDGVKVLYNLGTACLDKRDGDRAAAFFERAVRLGAANPAILIGLAEAYHLQKRTELAARTYEQAARVGPADRDTLLAMANVQYELGNWTLAAAHFDGALRADPAGAWEYLARFRAGYAFLRTGRYADAERMLLSAAGLDPGDPFLSYNLACLYALSGNPGKSLERLRRAVELGFRNPVVFTDPDLASVRGRAEFRAITGPIPKRGDRKGKG